MRLAPVLLAVVASAGCGESEPRGSGLLLLEKSYAGPTFVEGSMTELTLHGEDGGPIEVTQRASTPGPAIERRLPAGRYRLEAVERPCQGTCGQLDPPAEGTRCELDLEIRPGATTGVHIRLTGSFGAVTTECSAA